MDTRTPVPAFSDDAHLDLALAAGGLGAWRLQTGSGAMSWSRACADIYGASDASLGRWADWLAHVHPDDQAAVGALVEHLGETDGDAELQFRFRRPDGQERWLSWRCRLVDRIGGGALRIDGVARDDTDRRESEQRSRILLRELQHRVKSILAVVRSLAARTAEASSSLEDFSAHFEGRLAAMGRVQSVLARNPDAGLDLEQILRDEFLQCAADDGEQIHLEGDPVYLRRKTAEMMCLAIHELATNAVKFGALADRRGLVRVQWRVVDGPDGGRLIFDWREQGVRLIDPAPSHTGFGRDLIERGLPYELGAETELSFSPGGLKCRISTPFEEEGGSS